MEGSSIQGTLTRVKSNGSVLRYTYQGKKAEK